MSASAKFLDFQNYEKIKLLKKYEYFHINKVICEVHLIKQKDTGKLFVANITHPEDEHENRKSPQRLINNLYELNQHPSILKIVGHSKIKSENRTQTVVITEFHSKGTLSDMIESEKVGNSVDGWSNTKKLISIYGIAAGLLHMHSKNILHRDVKPSKILLDDNLYPKIRGFNLSIKCNDKSSQKVVKSTPEYMAPEIILREPSSKAMDVYSFAMTMYEILSLHRPFEEIENLNVIKVLQKIESGKMPAFKENIPKAFQKLIDRCWSKNPLERPNFEEIVDSLKNDPEFIFEGVDKEEYFNYINFVDQHYDACEDDVTFSTYTEEEKVLREQIHLKNEEHIFLLKEIERLKKNLNEEKEKLQNAIQLKEKRDTFKMQ